MLNDLYTIMLIGTKEAADSLGLSMTHFNRLAQQNPVIEPIHIKGSPVVAWTPELVEQIRERKKR